LSPGDIYYGFDGEPIDEAEWMRLFFHEQEARQVAHDVVGGLEISTVWHGMGLGHDPPLIYETKVWREGGGPLGEREVETWSYPSREDAEKRHAELVEQARVMEGA
jgi:hypothetical protein